MFKRSGLKHSLMLALFQAVFFIGVGVDALRGSSVSVYDDLRLKSDELMRPLTLHVVVFETDDNLVSDMVVSRQTMNSGIKTTVFGVGEEFEGFGSKWNLVVPLLKNIPSNELVAIVDSRDVLLNIIEENNFSESEYSRPAVDRFVKSYRSLTLNKPGAIVMGAEAQCCVTALTHVKPGDYFDSITGERAKRSCRSGEDGCYWEGDAEKMAWEVFQQELAHERTGLHYEDVYLNSGTVAGLALDILNVIQGADISSSEDDQAVFTDLMYHRPDLIVLDYAQNMFGVARWSVGMEGGGCLFDTAEEFPGSLVHSETDTAPLFLHTPGQFFECYNALTDKLQLDVLPVAKDVRRLQNNYAGGSVDICIDGITTTVARGEVAYYLKSDEFDAFVAQGRQDKPCEIERFTCGNGCTLLCVDDETIEVDNNEVYKYFDDAKEFGKFADEGYRNTPCDDYPYEYDAGDRTAVTASYSEICVDGEMEEVDNNLIYKYMSKEKLEEFIDNDYQWTGPCPPETEEPTDEPTDEPTEEPTEMEEDGMGKEKMEKEKMK